LLKLVLLKPYSLINYIMLKSLGEKFGTDMYHMDLFPFTKTL